MDMKIVYGIVFFILVAIVPSVIWIVWLNKKAPAPPDFKSILAMFGWGALFAVIIALVLNTLIPGFSPRHFVSTAFFTIVIVAPFVEEMAKPLGLRFVNIDINSISDGVILGATAGLGFAATENLLYELTALNQGGWSTFWATAILRSIAACALHASATGLTGRGYAWAKMEGKMMIYLLPFYLLAVILHAAYNFLAISQEPILFAAALALSVFAIYLTRKLM